jgi:hypothetical protein
MKQTILFLLLCLSLVSAHGQNKMTISGFVYDEQTREPLIGANVYDSTNHLAAQTNAFGFYSFSLPVEGTNSLNVSFIGYQSQTITLGNKKSETKTIYLKPGLAIGEVKVTGRKNTDFVQKREVGVVKLTPKQVRNMPNLFGEVDLIKALQLTPGIQSGGEGKSNLYVRGGSPDQNLMLLDDVPLYYVAHFGGFLSVFNNDAISDITMIKGGFPARYGTRLSSVLDIRMKNGNLQKFGGQGTFGLLSSKISLEGPLIKGKSSFIISARKNIIPILKFTDAGISYNFYDLNAKVNYTFSESDKVFLSFYNGDDQVGVNNRNKTAQIKQIDEKSTRWGNLLAAFRWNHLFTSKLFSNTTLSFTDYKYQNLYNYEYQTDTLQKQIKSKVTTSIRDFCLKSDFTYYLNPNFEMRFGFSSIFHSFIPNNEHYQQTITGKTPIDSTYLSNINATEASIYAENDFSLKWMSANLGARLSSYFLNNQSYYSFEPRILLNFPLLSNLSLKYSFSKMNQYVHLLSYSGIGMPSDYWMPTTKNVLPETSIQNSLGIYYAFGDGKYEVSLESYYKSLNHLIAFRPGESLSGALSDWEQAIEKNGKGKAYGLELFIQKLTGKTTGWIGATLSKSERTFAEINQGKSFPFSYDRLFDASLVVNHEINKNIVLSATWTYGTGYPVTMPSDRYVNENGEVFGYSETNGYRMRDFHRLDLGVNFTKKKHWGERTWTISIFNVYNRKNPYFLYMQRDVILTRQPTNGGIALIGTSGEQHLYQKSLFPFFPSFAYSFKF